MLHDLNPQQREAVEATEGPVLVLAGAGTGKTKVLTYRIAHIIQSGLASPDEILAVTFTNKAAKEMQERVGHLIPAMGINIGTFHAVAAKILRRHADFVGLSSSFSIIGMDDQTKLIKEILVEQNVDITTYKPQMIGAIISKWKDLSLAPQKISNDDVKSQAHKIARSVYPIYQSKLVNSNVVDFGDLLLYNTELFTKYPDILFIYQSKYRYILVDEYQDTNAVQYLWTRMLSGKYNNICCVGDDDQSIYSWRGAEIANILRFEKDFKSAKVIKLERNYRSTTPILQVASMLIKCNQHRHGKDLWTEGVDGAPVQLVYCWNDKEEARFVIAEIKDKINIYQPNQIAILVRAGFQTRAFEEALIAGAVPYRIVGGLKFYERKEVRDILSYIRVVINSEDNIALERIINVPKRSVGDVTLDSIKSFSQTLNISMFAAIEEMLAKGVFKAKMQDTLQNFCNQIKQWRAAYNSTTTLNATKKIFEESGYQEMLKAEKTEESRGRLENIHEMLRAIADFNKIDEFLEHASLVADGDLSGNIENAVNLMTMHAAKGLEFDVVFLPGWEEGLFPHQKALIEGASSGLEEERRLAYVGITRAKKELYITYAESRWIFNEYVKSDPSRFINEIDCNMLNKISSNRNYPKRNYAQFKKHVEDEPTLLQGNGYKAGRFVSHNTFGKGMVIKSTGDSIEIAFSQHGIKVIKKDFVTLCD
jgi:DNA helicase-2/ATP-dependent DNA helicase PcrA